MHYTTILHNLCYNNCTCPIITTLQLYRDSTTGSDYIGDVIVADRREGGISTLNELNYFLTYSEMMIPTSNYWNIIYGTTPSEIEQDEEGKQIMRVLGKNMAYLLKVMNAAKGIVPAPEKENKVYTHFVR